MNIRTLDRYTHIDFDLETHGSSCEYTFVNREKNIILVKSLLNLDECNRISKLSLSHYTDITNEYEKSDRDCKRFLNISNKTAEILYDRIEKIMNDNFNDAKLKPFGFGTEGRWIPDGINPCFRHSEYTGPSNGFLFHRDSCYVHNKDIRSILSLVVYLDDAYENGEIMFVDAVKPRQIGDTVNEQLVDGYKQLVKMKPQTGDALIFIHDIIHCCLPVTSGIKTIIRTDILFKNITPNNDTTYLKDPIFLKCIEYYREANNQEMAGNVKKAGLLYEKGLALRQFH